MQSVSVGISKVLEVKNLEQLSLSYHEIRMGWEKEE